MKSLATLMIGAKVSSKVLRLTQLVSFCVGADDSLPENILYKGLKLPLRAA